MPPINKVESDFHHQCRNQARALGFDAVGFSDLKALDHLPSKLRTFLDKKYHGDMTWMEETAARRQHPNALWPEARSAIIVGMNYAPDDDPLATLSYKSNAAISAYARGKDYHDILKNKLKQLARWVCEAQNNCEVKVFVDTAPLMEKPLAQSAGLGWQGKHTNLVSRDFGSWLFLGTILTTANVKPDTGEADHCGSCQACIDICPTNAFPHPYQLDARRCIAYLTIEHKGQIDIAFRKAIGNRVFGCDDCLAVCPWNKYAKQTAETRFAAREHTSSPKLSTLIAFNDTEFRAAFAGTPVKRTGRDRIVRNALCAAGNSQDKSLLPLIRERLGDSSAIVRGMAVWALDQLAKPDEVAALRRKFVPTEHDAGVVAEWKLTEKT